MNAELTAAFVLHQRPYRETSLLLDVLTEHYGRVSLVAKGVRGKKRSQAGILQLYQPLLISWSGRGELQTLIAVETVSPQYNLRSEAALCGLYLNELLVKLLPLHAGEPEIFQAYQQALIGLQQTEFTEIVLRLFEKHLLSHLGYGLVLDREFESGQVIEPHEQYTYQADAGLSAWQPGHAIAISGRSLQHLMTERDFDQQSLNEIKNLMRSVIHFYLGGKPLQSRKLFAQLQQYADKN